MKIVIPHRLDGLNKVIGSSIKANNRRRRNAQREVAQIILEQSELVEKIEWFAHPAKEVLRRAEMFAVDDYKTGRSQALKDLVKKGWKANTPKRYSVRIESFRRQLLDKENYYASAKSHIDALRYMGVLYEDGLEFLESKYMPQIKRNPTEGEEETIFTISSLELV